jgi:hypothetical protein
VNRRAFLAAAAGALIVPFGASSAQAASSIRASTVLEGAEQYLGVPYIYGGNNPKVGLDCSSYVSLIWGIPRQSTDTIHNYSFEIGKSELMPGDALNLPFVGRRSHIRVFAGWATEDRAIAWMYECARGRGAVYRVIGYSDEYTPIRRYGFVPDVPRPKPELPLEYDVPNGRFFSQTGGNDGLSGFSVTDEEGIRFWSEFKRLGGVEKLGRPLTTRFTSFHETVQVVEKGVLHWDPEERDLYLGPFPPDLRSAAPAEAREPQRSPYLPKH